MSVRSILLMLLSFSDQVSLPYSMTLLKRVLCENTRDVRRGKSSLNFFNLIRDIELASATPRAHSMSPK